MAKYRSKFESHVAASFRRKKVKFDYEFKTFRFTQPAKDRKYTPDFRLWPTDLYVECKGKLTKEDRDKLIWARDQNPSMRLVILFMRARNPIRKGSKTTYGDWATANGFEWADWDTGKGVNKLYENKNTD